MYGRQRLSLTIVLAGLAQCGGCRDEGPVARSDSARAVAVVRLERLDPVRSELFRKARLTGSVEPWKQEHVGFEVGGRVEWMVEEGTAVGSLAVDEAGGREVESDVIARIGRRSHEYARDAAKAEKLAVEARAVALQKEIESVITAQRRQAIAERDHAEREADRVRRLFDAGNEHERELDRVTTVFKTAQAAVEQIEALRLAKEAELAALRAQVQQAGEGVRQAELNLEHTVLRTPFSGVVSALNVIPGAVVAAGQPVATVVMMDPIKIELAVSPETDRQIQELDEVWVYPPGRSEPIRGRVYIKSTVADPQTRTFKVSIMVRNRWVVADEAAEPGFGLLPRIKEVYPAQPLVVGRRGPLYVEERCLYTDDEGSYVWRVVEREAPGASGRLAQKLRLHKVRVVPGDDTVDFVGLFKYRILKDAGELADGGDSVFVDPMAEPALLAAGVPEGVGEGDFVAKTRERWLFHPGDLAEVVIPRRNLGPGFYVPMQAILTDRTEHHVFVVEPGGSGDHRVRKVPVELSGNVGELWGIRAADPEESLLSEGTLVVLSGAHYLLPGERVEIVESDGGQR